MDNRERYLCAARGGQPDRVPVAPELFYYIPARAAGVRCIDVAPVGLTLPFHRLKTWEAQLICARRFDCCGWMMPAANAVRAATETETAIAERSDGSREVTLTHHTPRGDLRERFWFPVNDASWHIERCVKDPGRDWPLYCAMFFDDAQGLDLSEVKEAAEQTGGQGIVSIYVGSPFTDWLCGARDGGYERVIYELLDRPDLFRPMQERYIAHVTAKTRWLCEHAAFDELFMGNEFSELPLLSPRLWREWDYPVMRAFCAAAAEYGAVTHCHQHGSVKAILPDIAASGLNVLCPLEGPPGGDVDLADVKRRYGAQLCLKGNVPTNLLLYGTPEQVRAGVCACLEAGRGAGGFILGTGDQVARDTPFENIEAFVAAGMEAGLNHGFDG